MRYVGERRIVIDGNPTPAPLWTPDRSMAGEAVVLIGGGPSLADLDIDVLRGHRFVAINSGCRKVRPIATDRDPLYFSDNSWAENRPELARGWPGPVITCNRNAKIRIGDAVRYIDVLALTMAMQVMSDRVQASSGHIAGCLMAEMGAVRLILVGFDCRLVNGRSHGHADYSHEDAAAFKERFLPGWRALAPAFAERGIEVINATPGSAIRDFPFMPLREALER